MADLATQKHIIQTYIQAWNQPTAAHIRAQLKFCWMPEGSYVGPLFQAQGINDLARIMLTFRRRYPAPRYVSHRLETRRNIGYYGWAAQLPDGTELSGIDVVEFSPDGRIARLADFFQTIRSPVTVSKS